jgi:hypothetical protein
VYFRRAQAIYEKKLGPDALDTADTTYAIGSLAYDMGDLATSHDELAKAVAVYDGKGAHSDKSLDAIETLGKAQLELGDAAAATKSLQRAVDEYLAKQDNRDAADSMAFLARARARAGALDEADGLAHRSLALVDQDGGTDSAAEYKSEVAIAAVALARGRNADAAAAIAHAEAHADGVMDRDVGAGELIGARALASTDPRRAAALAASAAQHLTTANRRAAASEAEALARQLGGGR